MERAVWNERYGTSGCRDRRQTSPAPAGGANCGPVMPGVGFGAIVRDQNYPPGEIAMSHASG